VALVGIGTEYLAPEASAPAVAATDAKAQTAPLERDGTTLRETCDIAQLCYDVLFIG